MTWNRRQKNWLARARDPLPPVPPTPKENPMPPVAEEVVLIVPAFPSFSPAAIAELLQINRCTVHYWLEQGKLPAFRDNIGERYVLREVLVKFVRDYLRRAVHE